MKNLIEFWSRTQKFNWHIPNPNTHKNKHIKSTIFSLLKKHTSRFDWQMEKKTHFSPVYLCSYFDFFCFQKKKKNLIWKCASCLNGITVSTHKILPFAAIQIMSFFFNYTWFYSNSTNCYYLSSFQFHCCLFFFVFFLSIFFLCSALLPCVSPGSVWAPGMLLLLYYIISYPWLFLSSLPFSFRGYSLPLRWYIVRRENIIQQKLCQ